MNVSKGDGFFSGGEGIGERDVPVPISLTFQLTTNYESAYWLGGQQLGMRFAEEAG